MFESSQELKETQGLLQKDTTYIKTVFISSSYKCLSLIGIISLSLLLSKETFK